MIKHNVLRLAILALLISVMAIGTHNTQAQDGAGEVVVLHASTAVGVTLEQYIVRGLREADSRNAEAVVIQLDTPGGRGDVMMNIVGDLRASDVPVIVFVGPRGARAASAGLFITLGGHVAAMAPETSIGASSPVAAGGEDLPSTLAEKAEELYSAEARSLAERRGEEAVKLADEAVKEARAVNEREALDVGLIDLIAEDIPDLLEQVDGMQVEVNGDQRTLHTAGASTVDVPMNLLERLQVFVSDPNIVALLLGLGPLLIIIEVRSPGGWVAGALGTVMTALALYGLGVLPVNWLGIVFILLALALFIVEIKAPVHGVLTATGAASFAVGLIILLSQPEVIPFGRLSIPMVVGQSVLVAAMFFGLAMMGLRAQRLKPATGYPALIGQVGRVTRDLDPAGMVQVFGERWRAASVDGGHIASGEAVEVVEAGKMRLLVRRANASVDAGKIDL